MRKAEKITLCTREAAKSTPSSMPCVRVSNQETLCGHPSLSLTPDLETPSSHCALNLLETYLHVCFIFGYVEEGPHWFSGAWGEPGARHCLEQVPHPPSTPPSFGRKDSSNASVSAFPVTWPVCLFIVSLCVCGLNSLSFLPNPLPLVFA